MQKPGRLLNGNAHVAQVPDTPLADQNRSTTGIATETPQGWPLVGNWTCALSALVACHSALLCFRDASWTCSLAAVPAAPDSTSSRCTPRAAASSQRTQFVAEPRLGACCRAIMNARWRIIGTEVVAKREQVELYYRAAITNVLNPYNITMRFFNYTSYPAVTAGRGVSRVPCCPDIKANDISVRRCSYSL